MKVRVVLSAEVDANQWAEAAGKAMTNREIREDVRGSLADMADALCRTDYALDPIKSVTLVAP